MLIIKIIIMLILALEAIMDIKTRKVHIVAPVIIAICAVTYNIISGNISVGYIITVLLISTIFVAAGIGFKKSIGMGDALILASLTLLTGTKIMYIAMASSICMVIISGILVILKKADRTTKMPFVPCILAGYIMQVIL